MSISFGIFDFNGTVYKPRDESPTYKYIAHGIKDSCMPRLRPPSLGRPKKLWQLWGAKKKLEALYGQIKSLGFYDPRKEQLTREIYEVFNREVIDGEEVDLIRNLVFEFVKQTAKDNVDHRILRPAVNRFEFRGQCIGILSCAYNWTIATALEFAYYPGYHVPDVNIVGDRLLKWDELFTSKRGKAIGFELVTHGRKEFFLPYFFSERHFDPKQTVFMGDSPEDFGCFEVMREGDGKVALPLLLTESEDQEDRDFTERCARDYNAYVFKDQGEWEKFLTKG